MENRKIQIAVIGSMDDLKISQKLIILAKEIGKEIAKNNCVLLFGVEGDRSSLPMMAANEAEKYGGLTVGFLWSGSGKIKKGSIVINTGQKRGGGREFSMIISADAVISLGGGSGTLMEMTMAYQAGVPVVSLSGSGGWSNKLSGKFLDGRKRMKIFSATNAKKAVIKAIALSIDN